VERSGRSSDAVWLQRGSVTDLCKVLLVLCLATAVIQLLISMLQMVTLCVVMVGAMKVLLYCQEDSDSEHLTSRG
jgi:hypothetical protein